MKPPPLISKPPPRLKVAPRPLAMNSMAQLSWQPKSADAVWTKREWTSLCDHLHNGNPATHFVMGFRDEKGCKKYVRSKKLLIGRAVTWAWDSVKGTAKSPLAFVPYSQNGQGQSRWGGLDFDAHNGEHARARELAFAAFRVLLNAPDIAVILETSGSGGWHVWAISKDFHPVGEWARMLRSIASTIGTTVADGVCEIFPPNDEAVRFGSAMRAPGSWNPSTDKRNEIFYENTRSSLESVLSGNSKKAPLIYNDLIVSSPIEKEVFLSPSPYRAMDLMSRLGITVLATRNSKLSELCGEVFHQVGHRTARLLVEMQFENKTVTTKATAAEHMASFEKLWRGLHEDWNGTLTADERDILHRLETDNERDAFRIIRSYGRKAKLDGSPDFPIARDNLADRLGITGKGVGKIRDKLAAFGAIEKTAEYVANKSSMRFRWTADVVVENPF